MAMTSRVLSVGNCGFDQSSIRDMVESRFSATVLGADTAADALELLRNDSIDLVLVNRIFDQDGFPGLDLIRTIAAASDLQHIPTMLISNFPDHQQAAVAAGARPGFGKRQLHDPATIERLAEVLDASADDRD